MKGRDPTWDSIATFDETPTWDSVATFEQPRRSNIRGASASIETGAGSASGSPNAPAVGRDTVLDAMASPEYTDRRRQLENDVAWAERPGRLLAHDYRTAGRGNIRASAETESEYNLRQGQGRTAREALARESPDDPYGITARVGDDPDVRRLISRLPTGEEASPARMPGLYLRTAVPNGLRRGVQYGGGDFAGYERLTQRQIVDTIIANHQRVRGLEPEAAFAWLFGGPSARAAIDEARRGPLNRVGRQDALYHASDPVSDAPVDPYGTGDERIEGSSDAPRMSSAQAERGARARYAQQRGDVDGPVSDLVSPGDIDEVRRYIPPAELAQQRDIEHQRRIRRQEAQQRGDNIRQFLTERSGGRGAAAIESIAREYDEQRDPITVFKNSMEALGGQFVTGLSGVGENFGDLIGNEAITNAARTAAARGRRISTIANPGYAPDSLPYHMFNGVNAVGQIAVTLGVGAATKSPAAVSAFLQGAQVYGDRYDQSRSQGRSVAESMLDATAYGVFEYIPERWSMGQIMQSGGRFGSSFMGRVAKGSATEAVQEGATEIMQIAYDQGIIGENMTWGQAWRRIKDSAIAGAIGGGSIAGAIHVGTGGHAGQQRREAVDEFAGTEFDMGGIDQAARDSFTPENGDVPAGTKPLNVTPQDEASPLPTELISEGKTVIDDVVAGRPSRPRTAPSPARTAPRSEGDQPGRFPIAGGYVVGDGFGARRGHGTHHGIDMFAPIGTPFQVGQDFEIVESHRQASARDGRDGGNMATVRIGNTTWFAMHLPHTVRAGQYRAGDGVLQSGDSGSATAAAPHIHWQPINDAARAIYAQGRRAVAAFLTGNAVPGAAQGGAAVTQDQAADVATQPERADLSWMQPTAQSEAAGEELPVTAPEARLPQPEQVDVAGRPASVEERFEVNGEPGVRLRFEDNTTLEESIARLQQRGVTIPPVRDGSRAAPIEVSSAADLARAGERVNTEPTEAQAESGNYSKAHVRFQGIPITIENPVGSTRRGTDANGQPWETRMDRAAYGYAKGSEAPDGEQADVYIGDNAQSDRAYVVDQYDPETGAFDETKTVLGANSREDALAIYDSGFSDGSGPQRRQGVTEMSVDEFREFLKTPHTLPVAEGQLQSDNVASDETGLRAFGGGSAQAIGDNLREMLLAKLDAGDLTENGAVSPILQVASAIRQRGGDVNAETFPAIATAFTKVETTGAQRQADLRAVVDQFAPAEADSPEATQISETADILADLAVAAPDEFYATVEESLHEGPVAEERTDAGRADPDDSSPAEGVTGQPSAEEPAPARGEGDAERDGPVEAESAVEKQPEDVSADETRPADVSAETEKANTSDEATRSESADPVANAKAVLQNALDALSGVAPTAAAETAPATPDTPALRSLLRDWETQREMDREPGAAWVVRRVDDGSIVTWSVKKAAAESQRQAQWDPEDLEIAKVAPKDFEGWEPPSNVVPFQRPEQPMFQRRLTDGDNPIFYSALERAVAANPTARASAAQWSATLSKAAGIKREELEWSGLFDWLDAQNGPVTRDELLGVIRDGGIQVEEVVLGEEPSRRFDVEEKAGLLFDQAINRRIDQIVGDEDFDGDFEFVEEQAREELDFEDFLEEAEEIIGGTNETQFKDWSSDPSNESYRELLITLPVAQGGNPDVSGFKTHWDQEAVIAHTRFMEKRDADGKRVLFVEEIQSDIGQAHRDQSTKIKDRIDTDFQAIVERMKEAGVLEEVCD